jgi:hypothetical protein
MNPCVSIFVYTMNNTFAILKHFCLEFQTSSEPTNAACTFLVSRPSRGDKTRGGLDGERASDTPVLRREQRHRPATLSFPYPYHFFSLSRSLCLLHHVYAHCPIVVFNTQQPTTSNPTPQVTPLFHQHHGATRTL